jgi:hypothetical protein
MSGCVGCTPLKSAFKFTSTCHKQNKIQRRISRARFYRNLEKSVSFFSIISPTTNMAASTSTDTSEALNLTCCFEDIDWRHHIFYTCKLTSAVIASPGTIVKSISGQHGINKSHSDVQGIDITGQNVEFLPRGFPQIFDSSNLVGLDIDSSGLKMLTRDDLQGLENLEQFHAGGNELTWLPDDLFVGMTKLKEFSFRKNKIKRLSAKFIENIAGNQPIYIDFRDNAAINAIYEPGRKISVQDIEELSTIIGGTCEPTNFGPEPDFTITSEELFEFRVHKSTLTTRSKVFAAACQAYPDRNRAHLDKCSIDVVEAFLQFLYNEKLPTMDNVMQLRELAWSLTIKELKYYCTEVLNKAIEVDED